jgi:hypothetical protein
MKKDIELIQQVLDQAVKSGMIANLESAVAVWQAWGSIKYKVEQADGADSTNTNS